MARIRTIKPEFWTSEQTSKCSRDARLLFIGLWNFCDDAGIHKASELRLKMEVLPGDSASTEEVRGWVRELIDNDLLIEYEVDGEEYWQVTGWSHQKIDQPNVRFPDPDGQIKAFTKRLGGKQRKLAYKKLVDRDGENCCKCGSRSHLAVDHIIPRSKGGTNEIDNLQLLCKPCNNEKYTQVLAGDSQGTRQVRGGDSPPEGKGMEGKGREKKYTFENSHMEIAKEMARLIDEGNGHRGKKRNLEDWANQIRIMCEQDEIAVDDVLPVFRWANRDEFWFKNILSPSKLREKWDQLVTAANGHRRPKVCSKEEFLAGM